MSEDEGFVDMINHVKGCLGGGFKYFYFHPHLGKIPILTNIFQRGWNHQLVVFRWIFKVWEADLRWCQPAFFLAVTRISSWSPMIEKANV